MTNFRFIVFLISIFIISFISSCSTNSNEQKYQDSKILIEKLTKFWDSGDLEMIDELFVDECVYEDVPDQTSYQGKDEVKGFLGELFEWSSDLKISYTNKYYGDDWAIVEWIWSGTQTGDIRGLIKSTGKEYSIRGTTIIELKRGKIKRLSDYYNSGRFLYQLGVKFVFPSGEILEMPE
jgi:steroid delta-isomerase-like uncharacterized protein